MLSYKKASKNETIHSLWIRGELGLTQLLTIKSFLDHNHRFVLWTYEPLKAECEVRDAREVLPESNIFFYRYLPDRLKFGGIAERLKAELLYHFGGWHVDLDVTCLQALSFDEEYVLRPHRLGVVANIIKAPARCLLAERYLKWTKRINENIKEFSLSFAGLCKAVVDLNLSKYIVNQEILGDDDAESGKYWKPFLIRGGTEPDIKQRAIHWCASDWHPNSWQTGSFYHKLIERYQLEAPKPKPKPEPEREPIEQRQLIIPYL